MMRLRMVKHLSIYFILALLINWFMFNNFKENSINEDAYFPIKNYEKFKETEDDKIVSLYILWARFKSINFVLINIGCCFKFKILSSIFK